MPVFTLSRRRAIVVVVGALAAVFIAAHLFASKPRPAVVSVQTARLAVPPALPPAARVIVIDVAGAVRGPGLYRLPQGSRTADAIARAGGTTGRADAMLVNLAAPLADGEQVLVPTRGAAAAGGVPAVAPSAASLPTAPINLNTATAEQLDALPGV